MKSKYVLEVEIKHRNYFLVVEYYKMLFEVMTKFPKGYVNEDHNQHDDVQLDLMFHNDAKNIK